MLLKNQSSHHIPIMCFKRGYPQRLGIVTEMDNWKWKHSENTLYKLGAKADKPLDWFATRELGQKPQQGVNGWPFIESGKEALTICFLQKKKKNTSQNIFFQYLNFKNWSWVVERKAVLLPALGLLYFGSRGISRKKRKARKLLVLPEELSILCFEKKTTLGTWNTEGEKQREQAGSSQQNAA